MPPKTVTSKSPAPAAVHPAKSGAPSSLIFTVAVSIGLGVLVHYKGIRSTPGDFIPVLAKASPVSLRRTIGVDADWLAPYIGHGGLAKTLLTLVALFQEALKSNVVLGLLGMITASAIPLTNFALLESLKGGRPAYLHSGVVIAILLLGQLILVGCSLNVFYVPLYAIARWSQARSGRVISPRPSPGVANTEAIKTTGFVTGLMAFPTCVIAPSSAWWPASNIVFQLFPLANLPLIFRRPDAATSAPASTTAPPAAATEDGLTGAKMMSQMSYQAAAMWIAGAYFARPALVQLLDVTTWRNLTLRTDNESLFFWDVLGSAFTLLVIVVIDSIVDAHEPKQIGAQAVHQELGFQDVIGAIPMLAAFGPGYAFCQYVKRREVEADAARQALQVKSK